MSPQLPRSQIDKLEQDMWHTMFEIESRFTPLVMTLMFHKLGHLVEEVIASSPL